MGTKMAEKWILASPEKWGKHGPENGKNGPKFHFRTIFGLFFPFSGPFFSFSGPFSTHFQVRRKSIFRPFSSPFRAGGPKWIYTRSTGFQPLVFNTNTHTSKNSPGIRIYFFPLGCCFLRKIHWDGYQVALWFCVSKWAKWSGSHMTRLSLGKGHRGTSKKFGGFLD